MKSHYAILLLLLLLLPEYWAKEGEVGGEAEEVYRWVRVEYDWPSDAIRQDYVTSERFIIQNNVVAGIKLYKQEVYLTVPRWRRGVPSTLNRVIMKEGRAVLQPYPSWEMQTEGDCRSLQYVQSMEVDPNTGYMWILDTGRVDILDEAPRNLCPPKLIIHDLNRNAEVHRYVFPNDVVNHTGCFLDDLVLDYVSGDVRFAYITDTMLGRLYVYVYAEDASYAFEDDSMNAETEGGFPIDGIAMSSSFDYVYFSPLDGLSLYQIPTAALRDRHANFSRHVRYVGRRPGRSGGLAYGRRSLFYSLLDLCGLQRWNVSEDAQRDGGYDRVQLRTESRVAGDRRRMCWVDSLGWGEGGYLWFTTNDLTRFLNRSMDFSGGSGDNMYVFKLFVGEESYLAGAAARGGRGGRRNDPSLAASVVVGDMLVTVLCLGLSFVMLSV